MTSVGDRGGVDLCVVSFSELGRDPRVLRQLAVAGELGLRTATIGFGPSGGDHHVELPLRPRPLGRKLMALASPRLGAMARAYAAQPHVAELVPVLAGIDARALVVNDVDPLPAVLEHLAAPVWLDAHELATEEWSNRPLWRFAVAPVRRWICARYLRRCAEVTTVAPGIAQRYRDDYGIDCGVVRNACAYAELEPGAVPERGPLRLVHHGSAIPDRGLEVLIDAATALGAERCSLDLYLVGDERYRRRLAARCGANARVLPPLPRERLIAVLNGYDVGLHVIPPCNRNHLLALPNKLFEFAQARLAVVVGPSPEMAAVVRDAGIGAIADGFGASDLVRAVQGLDRVRVAACKRAAHRAARALGDDVDRAEIAGILRRLTAARGAA